MECLLCFEAWLDQLTFRDVNNTTGEADKAKAALASLMHHIVRYLPQDKGSQWVEGFQIKWNLAHGPMTSHGYNASCPEEHHKVHAKHPDQLSQENSNTIDKQFSRQIADTMHGLFQGKQAQPVNNNIIDIDTPTFCTSL